MTSSSDFLLIWDRFEKFLSNSIDTMKNFKGTGTIEEVDDDIIKEITTFDHKCKKCKHNISKHTHEFWIEDGYQEYRMECLICGLGEDSISILPKDPRK